MNYKVPILRYNVLVLNFKYRFPVGVCIDSCNHNMYNFGCIHNPRSCMSSSVVHAAYAHPTFPKLAKKKSQTFCPEKNLKVSLEERLLKNIIYGM